MEDEQRRKFMETAYEQALKDVAALNGPVAAAESGAWAGSHPAASNPIDFSR